MRLRDGLVPSLRWSRIGERVLFSSLEDPGDAPSRDSGLFEGMSEEIEGRVIGP